MAVVNELYTMNPPTSTGTLPLQEFRRDTQPGWAPGDPSSPLRLYLEKLQLWYKTTTAEDEVVGRTTYSRQTTWSGGEGGNVFEDPDA